MASPKPKDIKEHWGTWYGLALAIVAASAAISAAFGAVLPSGWLAAVLMIADISIAAVWTKDRFSLGNSGKLRFVVAIYCDKKNESDEIEEDFVSSLKGLIQTGNLGRSIHIIQASSAEARALDSERAIFKFLDRKKAHFLIRGRIRTRSEADGLNHYLELSAVVRHAQLEKHVQAAFAKEIASFFPNGIIKIPKSDQLPKFKLTADWLDLASRYIIAIAALVSNDFDYAEKLLSDVQNLLQKIAPQNKLRTSMESRLRMRQAEVFLAQTRQKYFDWVISHSDDDLSDLARYLDQALKITRLNSVDSQLHAIVTFIKTWNACRSRHENHC